MKANAKAKKIIEQKEEIKNISGKHQIIFSLSRSLLFGVNRPFDLLCLFHVTSVEVDSDLASKSAFASNFNIMSMMVLTLTQRIGIEHQRFNFESQQVKFSHSLPFSFGVNRLLRNLFYIYFTMKKSQ